MSFLVDKFTSSRVDSFANHKVQSSIFKVQSSRLLHGETVKRAMLFNHGCGIYRNDVAVGEGRPNDVKCLLIQFTLLIGRDYHRSINDNEVGISGWQTLTLVENRLGYRELEQSIGLAFYGAKRFQLLFHFFEVVVLHVLLVIGTYI